MTIRIKTIPTVLSDNSVVYDVRIGELIALQAYDRDHAIKLARKLCDAINDHALEEALVWNEL